MSTSRALEDLRWILESGTFGAEWCSQLTIQCGWFSGRRAPGHLSREAGWVLFSVDTFGVWAFEDWWPALGHSLTAVLMVLLLSLLTCGFGLVVRPFQGLWRVLRRLGGPRVPDAVEELLPQPIGKGTRCVHWYGVGLSRPPDTKYRQSTVRGRGSRRRPNDLLIRIVGQVARLKLDPGATNRIDRHGLKVAYLDVLSCSSHGLRNMLGGRSSPVVHRCRARPRACQDDVLHIHEFSAVDTEHLIDACQHARLTSCRACWLIAGAAFNGLRMLAWPAYTLASCCRKKRCARRRPRHVNSSGYYRELDPDSESEADDAERPCHAIRIGVLGERGMRPLAPQGCHDEAQPELTTLLHEDAEVSDVGPRIESENHQVPLCAHITTSSTWQRSGLGIAHSDHKSHAALGGVPLCKAHLGVSAPPLAPGWYGLRRRRGGEGRSRSPSSASGTGHRLGAPVPPSAPSAIETTKGSLSHEVELPAGWRKPNPAPVKAGQAVLVRLQLQRLGRAAPRWALFEGFVEATGRGLAQAQPLGVHLPTLQLRLRIPMQLAQVGLTWGPDPASHRRHLEDLLTRGPTERTCASAGAQVHELPESILSALPAADGCWVGRHRAVLGEEELERLLAAPRDYLPSGGVLGAGRVRRGGSAVR